MIHRINTITTATINTRRTKSTHTVTMMAIDEDDIGGGGDVDDVGDGSDVDDGGEVDGDIERSGVHCGAVSSDRST